MNNYEPVYVYPLTESDGWKELSGELPVKMTNDYLFRALLQSDNETLKALTASLLHMDQSEITSAEVTNPILLGESINDKMYIMDVRIELNKSSMLNLEMQVIREEGWEERSLLYMCRMFDRLNRGSVYASTKPVIQIAICDFTLFKDYPEFYATYKLMNTRNNESVYTEKFIISNVNLKRLDLATEEDRKYGLDKWCRLFKATTWEEVKMIAAEDKTLNKAVSGVWQLTEEERIREQCRAREEWLLMDQWKTEELAKKDQVIAEKDQTIAEQDQTIAEQDQTIAEQDQTIKELQDELACYKAKIKPGTP